MTAGELGAHADADAIIRWVAWASDGTVVLTRGQIRKWSDREQVMKVGRSASTRQNLYSVQSVIAHLRSTGIVFDTPDG